MNIKKLWPALVLLVGCTGMERDCSSCNASNFGGDWVVVQYRFDGQPINCWQLHDVGITNEPGSDGIFWKDTATNNLVHISGWYNRVQVMNGNYQAAAKLVGVNTSLCVDGKYNVPND